MRDLEKSGSFETIQKQYLSPYYSKRLNLRSRSGKPRQDLSSQIVESIPAVGHGSEVYLYRIRRTYLSSGKCVIQKVSMWLVVSWDQQGG